MPEKDYIERSAALNSIASLARQKFRLSDDFGPYLEALKDADIRLRSVPAADARPNIPGKWIRENNPSYSPFDDSSEYLYRCSQCEAYNNRESAFCPDCGAQMRGGEQDGV